MSRVSLEALLGAALKRAAAEDRLDVAEHVLRALETLQRRQRRVRRLH
jgi:hypothetical protein